MHIKQLTKFLMSFVTAMENDDNVEMERLMQVIEMIFHNLCSATNEENKKQEIINVILISMKEKILTHYDVATFTRDLVIAGCK